MIFNRLAFYDCALTIGVHGHSEQRRDTVDHSQECMTFVDHKFVLFKWDILRCITLVRSMMQVLSSQHGVPSAAHVIKINAQQNGYVTTRTKELFQTLLAVSFGVCSLADAINPIPFLIRSHQRHGMVPANLPNGATASKSSNFGQTVVPMDMFALVNLFSSCVFRRRGELDQIGLPSALTLTMPAGLN
jgi:hypothetical protein